MPACTDMSLLGINETAKTVLVTGSAGFIGYHLCKLLLRNGFRVVGYDAVTDYYDVNLKHRRTAMLLQSEGFAFHQKRLEDEAALTGVMESTRPDFIIHLAAQAGVRHSIDQPRSYLDSNIVGTFNIIEAARHFGCEHLLLASTSSVYGANEEMPYHESQKCDTQMSFYAATKKANEAMSHSYAHLFGIPTTCFRFFTVYGPWGRPDMALFKFTKAILNNESIDVYNHGDMCRDFTYVDDLVEGIRLLMDAVPANAGEGNQAARTPVDSPVAPWRVVNIGNSTSVPLMDFIAAIEDAAGRQARKNFLPMQPGDVPATWADAGILQSLTGYAPKTDVREGVARFVKWYRDYYSI